MWEEFKRGLSVAHARQPVERAETLEYRNQPPGVCWGAVYCSIESILLNHPVLCVANGSLIEGRNKVVAMAKYDSKK